MTKPTKAEKTHRFYENMGKLGFSFDEAAALRKPSEAIRTPIADREAGALKRLAKIMANHPDLWAYHQSDPRGCALYVGRKADLNGCEINSNYNRGVAVCI